jgi:hypothetical protein
VWKRLTLGQIFTVAPPCMINATGAAHWHPQSHTDTH